MNPPPRIIARDLVFPETPRWHARRQAWYFVDIDRGEVFEIASVGPASPRLLHRFDGRISGLTFDDADGFYVSTNVGSIPAQIHHLTFAASGAGASRKVADLADRALTLNDMTRGPTGHLYVGAINFNARKHFQGEHVEMKPGRLHKVDPANGSVEDVVGDVLFPNGIVIPPGHRTLLMADSYRHRVCEWDLHADGRLANFRIWAQFDEADILDGMCLDAEGALWIATGRRLIRARRGGEIVHEVREPGLHITACMLGGADGRSLVFTGAASIDRRIVDAKPSGVVATFDVEVPGAGLPSLYA